MDLRSRYIQKFARVPLHLNYKLLGCNATIIVQVHRRVLNDLEKTMLSRGRMIWIPPPPPSPRLQALASDTQEDGERSTSS